MQQHIDDAISDYLPDGDSVLSVDRALREQGWHLGSGEVMSTLGDEDSRRSCTVIPLCVRAFAYIVSQLLRLACLYIFYTRGSMELVILQGSLECFATVISCVATCRDVDVRRWTSQLGQRRCGCILRLLATAAAFVGFGLFRAIHLKRAWAQQIHLAEVLQAAQKQVTSWTGPIIGAERSLPVALFTGVPVTLICAFVMYTSCPFFLHFECFMATKKGMQVILCASATLAGALALTVSIIGMDLSVSRYIRRHYQDPRALVTPMLHAIFRYVEVVWRVATLTKLLSLGKVAYEAHGVLLACSIPALDLLLGGLLLRWHSPVGESCSLHMLASCGLLLADATRFTDLPGCRIAAMRISRRLEICRLCTMCLGFGAVAVPILHHKGVDEGLEMVLDVPVLASLLAYMVLRCARPIRCTGHDLHSAAKAGLMEELNRLLRPGVNDEWLDVNGETKDRRRQTPLMLAAERGHREVVELLLAAGAYVSVVDSRDQTPLHYAVRRWHWPCIDLLVAQPDARKVLQDDSVVQSLLTLDAVRRRPEVDQQRLRRLLCTVRSSSPATSFEDSLSNRRAGQLQSVRARLTIGRQLAKLFPNIEPGEGGLQELRSVSAVLVASALGSLARPLLPVAHGERLLESLRAVRTLGRGGQGTVIEVEYTPPRSGLAGLRQSTSCPLLEHAGVQQRRGLQLQRWRRCCGDMGAQDDLERALQDGSSVSSSSENLRFAMKLQAKRISSASAPSAAGLEASGRLRTTTVVPDKWLVCSEALALRRVVHPFIVRLRLAFQTQRYYVLMLELCPGGSLNGVLCRQCRRSEDDLTRQACPGLPPERAARYAGQALIALDYLHEHSIVYRDVKPDNLLLSQRDEVKLADFGLALRLDRTTAGLPSIGTPGYLAPELLLGTVRSSPGVSIVSVAGTDSTESNAQGVPRFEVGDGNARMQQFFKADAFSYGVTLALLLLGEACGHIEVDEGEVVLTPNALDDVNRNEATALALRQLEAPARTLLDDLLQYDPHQRRALREAVNDDFFLVTLGCSDLKRFLLRGAAVQSASEFGGSIEEAIQ